MSHNSGNQGPFAIAILGAGGISNAHSAAVKDSGGALRISCVIDTNR